MDIASATAALARDKFHKMETAKGFDKIRVKWIAIGTVPFARDKKHRRRGG